MSSVFKKLKEKHVMSNFDMDEDEEQIKKRFKIGEEASSSSS